MMQLASIARAVCTVLSLVLGGAVASWAQSASSASIQGRVTDGTGGALPGVTVTASSPALQVRQLSAVSDVTGAYRFADLPAGVYRITFELQGFQTFVRDELRLNVGFTARVDASLDVGGLAETITVSGESPVVDATTTSGSTNFTSDTLQTIPFTKTLSDLMAMVPGMTNNQVPDTGTVTIGGGNFENYGTSGQVNPLLEGISNRQSSGTVGNLLDFDAAGELQITNVGALAETPLPGVVLNFVAKSGGNEFHGRYSFQGQHRRLQSGNIDDELRAQNVTVGDAIRYYVDVAGDLGGRLIRDKLWFYGAIRDVRNQRTLLGYVSGAGPDGVYLTADDVPGAPERATKSQTAKLSYQATSRYRLIAFWNRNTGYDPERGGGRFRPFESTANYKVPFYTWKGELQGTPSQDVLFNIVAGRWGYVARQASQPGFEDVPSRFFRDTGLNTGPNILQDRRPRERWQVSGSLSFFPRGRFSSHRLKIGGDWFKEMTGTSQPNNTSGNYVLVYDRVGGVYSPAEIQTYNFPFSPQNRLNTRYAYVQDSWAATSRLTVNLGLRFDYYDTFVPAQTKEQGQFGNAGEFPRVDVVTWSALAPRAGVAFDLGGDGRTVLKAAYGWFNHTPGDDFAAAYNQNTQQITTYRWRDLDGSNNYTPGEVDLSTNGGDFLTTSGAANNLLNPGLQQPRTQEVALTVERELMANFSARAEYVYRRQQLLFNDVNVLRPYSAFNIPLTRRDPGPDGVVNTPDDAGDVTIYDYDPAFRGAAFVGNQRVNRASDRDDYYQTLELTLNKRMTGGWSAMSSLSFTKNHRWIVAIPQSPNDDYFPLDETWEWQYKLTGAYELPWDSQVSANYQLYSGLPGQRTYIFRAADPLGGVPLRQQNTVTLRLEPFGDSRGPVRSVLNLRASKRLRLGGARRLQLSVDALNALNGNAPWAITRESGPTFGFATQILSPRVLRVGATFEF